MSGLTVVVTDWVSREGLAPLDDDERFHIARIDDSLAPEFAEALRGASGLIVRSATQVGQTMLDAAQDLKVIGRAGVGIDNIDVDAASQRGIAVLNAPGGNTVAATELTMALILSVVRRVTEADRSVREGKWDRSRFRGVELRGRTLGLVGAGRIGGEVARRCRAFDMDVIAYDPYLTQDQADQLRISLVELEDVLTGADVISIHVPLNAETRGLIGESALEQMRSNVVLVNASRGGVVDEAALARALSSGAIAGAALDVYESEPLPADSPLLGAPNLVLTPHLGASTHEAQVQVALEVADGIKLVLTTGDVTAAVNAREILGGSGLS